MDGDEGGDETISLSDVLVARDACLPEDELWALCRECCLVLEVVNNSPEMFLTLCVTPDTVAFDQVGNVCFLDLDVDAEPIYIPPEYDKGDNQCKAHLFSLGMTLLYAAEYNGDTTQEPISPELRDLLGRMTADFANSRPDLESVIILCEEQLCGQSSQEVCSCIPAVTGFGVPPEANFLDTQTSFIEADAYSPEEDFSHADESYLPSEAGDTTYCEDIPDITEDTSRTEDASHTDSLGAGESQASGQGEATTEPLEELPLDSDSEMEKRGRRKVGPQSGSSSWGLSEPSSVVGTGMAPNKSKPQEVTLKPVIPPKPKVSSGGETSVVALSDAHTVNTEEIPKSKIPKPSFSKPANQTKTNSVPEDSKPTWRDLGSRAGAKSDERNASTVNGVDVPKEKSSGAVQKENEASQSRGVTSSAGVVSQPAAKTDLPVESSSQIVPKTRKNKRKQGVTITEILETLERCLVEPELWALCKEGAAALLRKKKHLPAYLSPDTLLIRESGAVSFKAIPEEKPLEVIFMAPELQTKGELSEKTCLFGLSVTLRCAAGKKFSSVASMNVSQHMKDLLQFLADPNPVKRPELADITKVCTEQGNGTGSDVVCRKIFQETVTLMNENAEKENQSKTNGIKSDPSTQSKKPKQASESDKSSAFKPVPGTIFQPIKPAASVGVEPIKPSPIGSGGAFCPVPRKQAKEEVGEPRIPSAFSSPATHFKPIVLQQTLQPTNENEAKEKTPEKVMEKKPSAESKKASSPEQPADKDKEVVRKLKELKKNLMKHRQTNMAKEIENEDKTETGSPKASKPSSGKSSVSSTPSKKSSIPSKKSGSGSTRTEGRGRSGKHSNRGSNVSGEALDSLLKEIQKQGTIPDTQSLATAIAQYLQGQLGTKSETQSKQTELDLTVTSAHVPSQGEGQPGGGQGQTTQQSLPSQLPNLNIPTQYHSQLAGQTMTLPMQYGGSAFAGFPQVQLQPDPVTGYIQLVPVNALPVRPPSGHSHAGSIHSAHGSFHTGSPVTAGSGSGKESGKSPHLPPQFQASVNQNDPYGGAISGKPDSSSAKPKTPHGRTARDLVHKTANLRAKNLGLTPTQNLLSVPGQGIAGSLLKWKSDHALDRVTGNEDQCYSDGEAMRSSGARFSVPERGGFVYDDSMLHMVRNNPNVIASGLLQYSPREGVPRHRTHSNSSSPSPSKDSGVSGMTLAFKPLPPGTEASLMDRLLSNVNVKQQKKLGKIVHLLREEFAFDGYMENGVEDLAMAEYVASLGVLKWDTFTSAICEKYSDLYWGTDLLANLYQAVNGEKPVTSNRQRNTKPSLRRSVPLQAGKGRRSRQEEDVDSSSLSESNTRETENRLHPELLPFKEKSTGRRSGTKQVDTSDSTDTENYAKRRRFRTKHELDKTKSSSSINMLSDGVPLPADTVTSVDSAAVASVQPGTSTGADSQPSSADANSRQSLPGKPAQQSHPDSRGSHPSQHHTSPRTSQNSLLNGKASTIKYTSGSEEGYSNVSTPRRSVNASQTSLQVEGRLSREVSISSQSSCQSELNFGGDGDVAMETVQKIGHVVYHWAMIHLSMTQEVENFMQSIDEENPGIIRTKLASIDQQMRMEKRMRRKTQKYYQTMRDSNNKGDKTQKGEKNTMSQVAKDITEMTHKVHFLELCKTHLEMLLAELQGIDISYLFSIAECPDGETLQLRPRPDNPLLQFQTLREPTTGCEIQALHAGTPEGLMAYLFASTALSDGYIHQFLYCFRYFVAPEAVLRFLITRYVSAARVLSLRRIRGGSTETNIGRLQRRVVDMVHFWLEGYYSIDFQDNNGLVYMLQTFIRQQIPEDSDGGRSLVALLTSCKHKKNLELSSDNSTESEMHFWEREESKKPAPKERLPEWESFKQLVRGKSNAKDKVGKVTISSVCVERRRRSEQTRRPVSESYMSRRTDTFTLIDYTPQTIAEQLTLIQQDLFQQTHPVHYLNSKYLGVGVAMTMSGLRTPAVTRRSSMGTEEREPVALFVAPLKDMSALENIIQHAQEVAHWVAGEIVACSNPKSQVVVLTKFLNSARICMELRNFATSMAILDGLETLVVKQLPAWKHLSTKCISILEDLDTCRMFLKNDPLSLMQQGKDCHLYPTIPSVVLFLLHVQQLEIGGFQFANKMYKWGKFRSITQVIDQVRVFREHMYGFQTDTQLQETLRQRIHEFSTQDILTLASHHDINYQKMAAGSGISGAFRKMKGKFQSK